jgi:hypothetical protein
MNTRILEFAEQAGLLGPSSRVGKAHKATEKFAELIIKDAIKVLMNRYMGDNNREDMEVMRCIANLKKHFGIEE